MVVRSGVAVGTVKFWNAEEGWGVLVSQDLPGDVWVHLTMIRMGGLLEDGRRVEFAYEVFPQDGCWGRAKWVRLVD